MKKIQISEEKLNQLANEISQRLFQSHYFGKGAIGGENLKNFCDYEQINKFLLFQVYQVWHLQVSRFKHPYFNFEQPEIHQLLKKLQNLLSRHIEIKQEDFKPLLQKAVYNNLKLLTSPREALENFFFQNRDKISIELYQRYTPFFADFNFVINSILRYHEKHEMKEVSKDAFFQKMERVMEVYEQKSQQDVDTYRSLRFYNLTNRHLEEVVAEDAREQKQREAQRKQEEEARLREEAQKQRQEAMRKEAEEQAREEEKRKAELSFFDDLEKPKPDLIDLDTEEEPSSRQAPSQPAPQAGEAGQKQADPAPPKEAKPQPQQKEKRDMPQPKQEEASERKETIFSKIKKDPRESHKSTQADRLKNTAQEMQKDSILNKLKNEKTAEDEKKPTSPPTGPKSSQPADSQKGGSPQKSDSKPAEEPTKPKANSLVDLLKARREAAMQADQQKEKKQEPEVATEKPKETAVEKEALVEKGASKEEAKDKQPQPPKEPLAQSSEPQPKPPQQPQTHPKVSDLPNNEEEKKEDVPHKGSLLSKFKKKTENWSDIAKEEASQKTTLADRFRKENREEPKGPSAESTLPTGEPIKPDEIPIHLQYRYVQKVFGGNNVRFRIIVDKVNNAESPKEVEEILDKYIFSNSKLNPNDELVQDFAALMRRRF
jgi:hypothetical protein